MGAISDMDNPYGCGVRIYSLSPSLPTKVFYSGKKARDQLILYEVIKIKSQKLPDAGREEKKKKQKTQNLNHFSYT